MPIPKIIHLTWKTREIPLKWKRMALSWKQTNPDWKIKLWTDEDNRNYIEQNYPEFLHTFDSYPYGIQRADAIRYFLLKDFGGVYCDLDIEVLGSLNQYFDNTNGEVFLVQSGNVPVFTNCFMASKPGIKFWDEVIDRLKNPQIPWYALSKHFYVMYSTGPLMLNSVAKKTKSIVGLLPRNVFMAYSVADDSSVIKPGALLRNFNEGSWNSWDSLFLNFCFRYGISILIFLAVLGILTFYIRNREKINGVFQPDTIMVSKLSTSTSGTLRISN
jgi:inositol phosphorylceramide mannosyltransferase catalytic subunit